MQSPDLMSFKKWMHFRQVQVNISQAGQIDTTSSNKSPGLPTANQCLLRCKHYGGAVKDAFLSTSIDTQAATWTSDDHH